MTVANPFELGEVPGDEGARAIGEAVAREMARLANEMFGGSPAGAVPQGLPVTSPNAVPVPSTDPSGAALPVPPSGLPRAPLPGGVSDASRFAPPAGEFAPSVVAPYAPDVRSLTPNVGLPGNTGSRPSPNPGVVVPPRVGPSALQIGAGGVSPTSSGPPLPGYVQQLPIPQAPPPKETDLRAAPTLFADAVGLSTPFPLLDPVGTGAASDAPYFLAIAGLPGVSQAGLPGVSQNDTNLARAATPPVGQPGPQFGVPTSAAVPTTSRVAFAEPASVAQPAVAIPRYDELVLPTSGSSLVAPSGSLPRNLHPFDPEMVKRDFPILQQRVHGKQLVWLDNAATTQKPRAVIDRLSAFYERENSNIHRAAHALAARATDAYEAARDKVRRFLHAGSTKEIVFVRGATEAINLVAQSWGRRHLSEGDEIVVTHLEHHANIVPWQQIAYERKARLRVAPVDDRGQVILEEYEKLLNPRTKIVSFTQVSNALGTVVPAQEMVAMAHRHGARVLVDGAQAVSHMAVDVQALDCDFYVFSGHKVFGPTGIGVLFGKEAVLEEMPPWQGGGNMIQDVTFERTTFGPVPAKFEAGTGNIGDAVGLGAALDYLEAAGLDVVARHEHDLLVYGTERLAEVPGLRMIGTALEKAGVLSFVIQGLRTEEMSSALDREGIAVRSGHHCAQPILRRFGVEATVRASLALYNTRSDLDALVTALLRLQANRTYLGR